MLLPEAVGGIKHLQSPGHIGWITIWKWSVTKLGEWKEKLKLRKCCKREIGKVWWFECGTYRIRDQKEIFSLRAWRMQSLGLNSPKIQLHFESLPVSWKNYNWYFGMNGMVCMYLRQTIVHFAIISKLSDLLLYISEKILLGINV